MATPHLHHRLLRPPARCPVCSTPSTPWLRPPARPPPPSRSGSGSSTSARRSTAPALGSPSLPSAATRVSSTAAVGILHRDSGCTPWTHRPPAARCGRFASRSSPPSQRRSRTRSSGSSSACCRKARPTPSPTAAGRSSSGRTTHRSRRYGLRRPAACGAIRVTVHSTAAAKAFAAALAVLQVPAAVCLARSLALPLVEYGQCCGLSAMDKMVVTCWLTAAAGTIHRE